MALFSFQHSHGVFDAMDALPINQMGAAALAADAARIDRAEVEERMDQMLLVCAAMWELLSEKAGMTENDLVAKIAEIDARDGVADGKMTYSPVKCAQCQRTIFPKQQRCLYCGAGRPVESVFKTI